MIDKSTGNKYYFNDVSGQSNPTGRHICDFVTEGQTEHTRYMHL